MSMIPHGSGGTGAKTADKVAYNNTNSGMSADNVQDAIDELNVEKAPAYTYGTEDLTAGTSPLETGKLYFVHE